MVPAEIHETGRRQRAVEIRRVEGALERAEAPHLGFELGFECAISGPPGPLRDAEHASGAERGETVAEPETFVDHVVERLVEEHGVEGFRFELRGLEGGAEEGDIVARREVMFRTGRGDPIPGDRHHFGGRFDGDDPEPEEDQDLRHPARPAPDLEDQSAGCDPHCLEEVEDLVHLRVERRVPRCRIERLPEEPVVLGTGTSAGVRLRGGEQAACLDFRVSGPVAGCLFPGRPPFHPYEEGSEHTLQALETAEPRGKIVAVESCHVKRISNDGAASPEPECATECLCERRLRRENRFLDRRT
ncbi:MAG: hypothetical protein BWX64_02639 [Acidobacteria bacterium ADurb.Bin051]|nr:MAG: hypothetical protein BWX64_02639 [Acidobacteria bacterium ADurb.Bin051]